jgi:hypothetical protein
MAVLKTSPFITKLREIEASNKLIFDKFDSKEIDMNEAQIMSNKLWKDFIYTFHYPHEAVIFTKPEE